MERLGKKPAFVYAKDFSLSQVLGNLQAYKIVTGQVSEELNEEPGSSKEEVYGNLVRNAGKRRKRKIETSPKPGKSSETYQKPENIVDYEIVDEDDDKASWSTSQSTKSTPLDLRIPESILAYGGDSSSSDNDLADQEQESAGKPKLISPTCKIVTDAVDEDDEFQNDFFGLNRQKQRKLARKSETVSTRNFESSSNSKTALPALMPVVKEISTISCTNCDRRGHVAIHCTVRSSSNREGIVASNVGSRRKSTLGELFARCKKLRVNINRRCSECGITSNLAHCMECNVTLCDGKGHLRDHLLMYPLHNTFYSYKLQRILKCQNPQCDVTDVYKLLKCRHCLDKSFSQHYSMINATWSRTGLHNIPNSIACDEHFLWHRMNCGCNSEETLISRDELEGTDSTLISEFYF